MKQNFRHKWLWALIIVPAITSVLFIVSSLITLFIAPNMSTRPTSTSVFVIRDPTDRPNLLSVFIPSSHVSSFPFFFPPDDPTDHSPVWTALKDIGPAIAGSWVLSAALFALTAAGVTILAAAKDAEARDARRKASIREVCIGEIHSFWDRANQLELHTKLENHLQWLKSNKPTSLDVFRRNLGDDWFLLSHLDPLAIGELGIETSARYLSLSARVRHLVSRLNWLNATTYKSHDNEFWIHYHNDTLEALNNLFVSSSDMLRRLGDTHTVPATFKFFY